MPGPDVPVEYFGSEMYWFAPAYAETPMFSSPQARIKNSLTEEYGLRGSVISARPSIFTYNEYSHAATLELPRAAESTVT